MTICGPILVFLGAGVRGSAIMRAAEQRGHAVRAISRTVPSPHAQTSRVIAADLDNPASLLKAARGCAHAVVQVPTGSEATMVRQITNALDASVKAGIRSIVLMLASASRSISSEPSFVANAAIEGLVRSAAIPFNIVRPTMYLDNLLKPSAREDIVQRGLFEPPIAVRQRIAWTSTDDCARAAILLLEQDRHGVDYLIAGPESVTGDRLAASLSAGLGRSIVYRAQSIDAFEKDVDTAMGRGMGRRIASKFRYFRDHPDDADLILATPYTMGTIPGFAATTIQDWICQRRDCFC